MEKSTFSRVCGALRVKEMKVGKENCLRQVVLKQSGYEECTDMQA